MYELKGLYAIFQVTINAKMVIHNYLIYSCSNLSKVRLWIGYCNLWNQSPFKFIFIYILFNFIKGLSKIFRVILFFMIYIPDSQLYLIHNCTWFTTVPILLNYRVAHETWFTYLIHNCTCLFKLQDVPRNMIYVPDSQLYLSF